MLRLILVPFLLLVLTCCATRPPIPGLESNDARNAKSEPNAAQDNSNAPAQFPPGTPPQQPQLPPGIDGESVPVILSSPTAEYLSVGDIGIEDIDAVEIPQPKRVAPYVAGRGKAGPQKESGSGPSSPDSPSSKLLASSFDTTDFDTNATHNGGFVFIPPDSHAAAGANHLVNVVNATIRFHQKDGTLDLSTSLASFFAPLVPVNALFDPKVLHDQFEDRFVVVAMERTDTLLGDPSNTSRILVAVSDDGDPNGTWRFAAINSFENIGVDSWADYPGFGVDEEAVYITANMFGFLSFGGAFTGTRLWVIDKGVVGGFYAGSPAIINRFDPYAGGGAATTTQPAHIFGTPPPGAIGTFLVSYSGFTGGGVEFFQVVRIDNPLLAVPTFTQQFVGIGNFDDTGVGIPDAPQSGTATDIDNGDRRALDADWQNNNLYLTTTIIPPVPSPDFGQSTAAWARMDTTVPAAITAPDLGTIGGEGIAATTFTAYPSLAVNSNDRITIGFSAFNSGFFASSYYTGRELLDPGGMTDPPTLLRAGTDFYIRTFGGPDNRWGDYSSVSVDPVTDCFWVYNQHAMTRGTITMPPTEDGRWRTALGQECSSNSAPVAMDDSFMVNEAGLLMDNVRDNDTDDFTPTNQLVVNTTPVSGVSDGILTLNADGSFSYQHGGTHDALDGFEYEVCDTAPMPLCDNGLVTLNVTLLNDPPQAMDDSFMGSEGGMTVDNVRTNDVDEETATGNLVVNTTPVSTPSFGGVVLTPAGGMTYTHDGTENFTDSFDYEVCDDGSPAPVQCDTATVNLMISQVNDPPTAIDDSILVNQGAAISVLVSGDTSLLDNDIDPDSGTLEVGSGPSNGPVNGMASIMADGTFTYTHDNSTAASDSFEYEVCDDPPTNSVCDTGQVNVSIDLRPQVVCRLTNQIFSAGDSVSIDASGSVSDAGGVNYSATGLPGSLSISSAGMITGTLTGGDVGGSPYGVTVTGTDGAGQMASSSFVLEVLGSGELVFFDSVEEDCS